LANVSLVVWSLYRLSFGHCIACLLAIVTFVVWPVYHLSFDFFEIRLLVTFCSFKPFLLIYLYKPQCQSKRGLL
jgi:hypothetical protein